MKPIFLIGFMGSGKSTLAEALAAATGLEYIDLDTYIECRFHANIRDIFASEGEARFREIERSMLREVSTFENVIIACGGGTPCFFDNMDLMNSRGLTVMLNASHGRLLERLKLGRARRPLIAAMTDDELSHYISEALDQRMPHYSKAAATFNADWLDSRSQIDKSVDQFRRQFLSSEQSA